MCNAVIIVSIAVFHHLQVFQIFQILESTRVLVRGSRPSQLPILDADMHLLVSL